MKDGLSFGIVNGITQDNNGFMWFATGDGLNRFDGTNFKLFKFEPNNPYSLPSNYVETIYKDTQGNIWMSSRRGIYQFDTNRDRFIKFAPVGAPPSCLNNVSSIFENKQKQLWFSCGASGFSSYNIKTQLFKNYTKKELPGLLGDLSVINVVEDTYGLLWVGTRDGGLNVFSTRDGAVVKNLNDQFPLKQIPQGLITRIYEDHNHDIWIATSKGLVLYRRNENKFLLFLGSTYKLRSNYFFSLLEDEHKNLLVGLQDGGLYNINLEEAEKSSYKNITIDPVKSEDNYSITARTIQTLFQDRDKNIWAGTYGDGIYMLSNVPEKFRKFQNKLTDAYGSSFLRYYGMCIDDQGYLWMGTDGDGIYKKKLDGEVVKYYRANGQKGALTSNNILCAYKDHSNRLWFGSYSNGLFRYDKKTDSFTNFVHKTNDPTSICLNDIRAITEDSENNLWVGTNGGGLSLLTAGSNKFINYNPQNSGISSDYIRALAEDRNGNLFIGTSASGLKYYIKNQNKFINYFSRAQAEKFLPSHFIYSLYLDKNENLYIGTEGDGLVLYDIKNKKFKRYTEKDGLADNTVNAIQKDEAGDIWISTNKGLSRIDVKTNKIINYDGSDGLQGGQFNPGSSMYCSVKKFMVFGGTEGYNVFYPAEVKQNLFKPKVLITGLQLFGKEVEVGQKDNILSTVINKSTQITLNPGQSVFSIQYVALNYAYAEKSEFAYKLIGLEKNWNYVKNQRSVTYRYLPAGDYLFKVKAANQDGIWFENYATLKIRILPPWYKAWWAYLSYILIVATLIYYYLTYRSNEARLKYEVKIAQISAEKEKELNERKLSFFTNISHEFRTPLTLIINPVKELLFNPGVKDAETNNLSIVFRNARRLLSLVDQLLLFRKAESESDGLKIVRVNIVNLCKEVFLCFSHQAKSKNILFDFVSETDTIEVFADREKMEIVLFNLISNALKFTPDYGMVNCYISQTETLVNIEIKDTGPGIAENIGEQLFDEFYQVQNELPLSGGFGIGLYLAKKFIESHKGNISYTSLNGAGTIFKVCLVKGKEHLSPNLIFENVVETSVFLEELIESYEEVPGQAKNSDSVKSKKADPFNFESKSMLIVDDNAEMRQYLKQIFSANFEIFEAADGTEGLNMVYQFLPDIVISDVMMQGLSGIELCSRVKEDPALNHIPVLLLTASSSPEIKLKGIEGGADDYISKPFERELLLARVNVILKSKNNLQKYFYNEITLKSNDLKVPPDYKEFLAACIKIVEDNLSDNEFCIKTLADEVGMSHSNLYKRIRAISGQSANGFIRFIRLRKAAEMFLKTDCTVSEAAYKVGINDPKYFREQFSKLFGLNPSEYIKKFRVPFHANITRNVVKVKINKN
ncbi:hybrid sensor histidine kinase/response regulator transcription factor [Mucilaginibacter sp. FT3.2]|uniref:hybrid sensor histidine kinase/response regulator transcription factor n=1 Tax=Mucilaginibacter sp. FT3.2 TaxID=2723090 RepID=UPI0018127B9E|nr:two-component regulator propeller domain-containing protein [Mucilaginibacter sp. FT3.2]MBB6234527.1 ligand-binding sensor domain-containing protein/signal transduction histidine kinase/DNA-binding response OmpR family regulator [Mucilaginibacter sp. FT3.2]